MIRLWSLMIAGMILILPYVSSGQDNGIDVEVLIERILAVEQEQINKIDDIIFDAEYIEGEINDLGEFEEKIRITKKIFICFTPDTTFFKEEYLEYYKNGELQSEKDLEKEARERREKKAKRKSRDISTRILSPFFAENRDDYTIEYIGIAEGQIDDQSCYQFRVQANREDESLVNGDYYFEVASFHLVRVDFSPARLVKNMTFKLKELRISIMYRPSGDGFWLPYRFDVEGKGKATFFFGVNFAGTEYYRNSKINNGLTARMFEVENEK